jgi:hypothetical protein
MQCYQEELLMSSFVPQRILVGLHAKYWTFYYSILLSELKKITVYPSLWFLSTFSPWSVTPHSLDLRFVRASRLPVFTHSPRFTWSFQLYLMACVGLSLTMSSTVSIAYLKFLRRLYVYLCLTVYIQLIILVLIYTSSLFLFSLLPHLTLG